MNSARSSHDRLQRAATWLLLGAVAGIPLSLIWDFSWEATVGVDEFWAPAHTLGFVAVGLAGLVVLAFGGGRDGTVSLGGLHAPLGAWLVGWGALAFAAAVLFNRWWQSAYGLAAGLWHPPQILEAGSCFVLAMGAWLLAARWPGNDAPTAESKGGFAIAFAGGSMLALITSMTLTYNYPNRQHAASFFTLACATYPFVLAALIGTGRGRWPATSGAAIYTAIVCAMVWVLPLFPARPLTGPIHNPMDHLAPPPFPLLLLVPALAMDVLMRWRPVSTTRARHWGHAAILGAAFFLLFLCAQWAFAEFLLSDLSDNRFFAGGGRHWPFFLKIEPMARTQFWPTPGDEMNFGHGLAAWALAIVTSRLGLWFGEWAARVRR